VKNRKKIESNAETESLWRAFVGFVAGVVVVTAIDAKSRLRGMMTNSFNSFASVSMRLPLVPERIGQLSMNPDELYATGGFAMDILSDDRPTLSEMI